MTLFGHEVPRVFTPPLRELTPETSLGFDVIEFASDILEIDLFPWQRWLLIHALELREDGAMRFRNVIVLVARQNGKSLVSQVLALWWLYVAGCQLVLGTAQDLDTAEEVWAGAVEMAEETPGLAESIRKVVQRNGAKSLVLNTGERYRIKAANRKAGRGLSGDRILLDELREHQSWAAWGAITKTTMARPNAQVWCLSNAGDVSSVVLRYLRLKAHEALGDPDGAVAASRLGEPTGGGDTATDDEPHTDIDSDDLFLAEWSATPGKSVWDREGWAQANPSLGYTITDRTIASSARTDPEWVFRVEVLCQWPDGTVEGIFPTGTWEKTTNQVGEDGTLADHDKIDRLGGVAACVDMSHDRSRCWISFVGTRPDGRYQGEVVADRIGSDWVKPWLSERAAFIEAVTWQERGAPVSGLGEDLQTDREFVIPTIPWGGPNLTAGYGRTHDAIRDGTLRHNPQPALDNAAALARKRDLGDGWALDRRTSAAAGVDASPLVSFVGAFWLYTRPVEAAPPPPPPPTAIKAINEGEQTGLMPAGGLTGDLASMNF